jgi:hypothetical protein
MASWVGQRLLRSALLLGTAGVLPGCSFLFTTAPKRAESSTEFVSNKCTTSKVAPIVDTVIAGYQGFRTGYALAADQSTYDNAPISREADVALGVGFLALFGASAIYGYYVTGQCSARHDRAVVVDRPKQDEQESGDPNDGPPPPRSAPPQQWNRQPHPPAPTQELAP